MYGLEIGSLDFRVVLYVLLLQGALISLLHHNNYSSACFSCLLILIVKSTSVQLGKIHVHVVQRRQDYIQNY